MMKATTATGEGGDRDEDDDDNGDDINNGRLNCLQALSLGSNVIGSEGTACLVEAFERYPPLLRYGRGDDHGNDSSSI
jgi:hypothetical protein